MSSAPQCLWILNKNGTLIYHRDFRQTKFTANDRIRLASTLHGISAVAARISPADRGRGGGRCDSLGHPVPLDRERFFAACWDKDNPSFHRVPTDTFTPPLLRDRLERVQVENLGAYRREVNRPQSSRRRDARSLQLALQPRGIARTKTALRFILITDAIYDPKRAEMYLNAIYERFSVLVIQDPFVVSLDLPVTSAMFEQSVVNLVVHGIGLAQE
eukprot:g7524.t1